MWIFAKCGFVSIVEDRQAKNGTLLVRSRFAGDIEKLFPGAKVTRRPDRDYLFRANIAGDEVANAIAHNIMNINYDNFKNSTPKDRHRPYLRIWNVMMDEQVRRYPKSGYYLGTKLPTVQPPHNDVPFYQDESFDDWLKKQYTQKPKKRKL